MAYLATEDYVVYTYAAVTLDRLLLLKRDNVPIFTKTDLSPLLQDLLGSIFQRIIVDPRPEKLAENDFLIKCSLPLPLRSLIIGMMRVMVTSRDGLEPYMPVLTQNLVGILGEISKNPSNPRFNHYLFECLAALIRYESGIFVF